MSLSLEMEEELKRFEQEIAFSNVMPQASRPVIGAQTYNQISEQLHTQQQQMQHQAYSMYAEAIAVHPQEQTQSQPALQFIPHQLNTAAPAVYSARPVKASKIERPIVTIPPPKIETYVPKPIAQPPPLPVRKAPPVVPYENSYASKKKEKEKPRRCIRTAGGQSWEDTSMLEWELNDFRIFCGDLGKEVTDDVLTRAFSKYPTFLKAKVVRDKWNLKSKGYGFVSFKDPQDYIKAMREMNGKYVGSRPIKLRKSSWRERDIDEVRKKKKEKTKLGVR